MKKALALLSALALGSAAQSDGFLANNALYIDPVNDNPMEDLITDRGTHIESVKSFSSNVPRFMHVDDETYSNFNIVQNWHYPLKPLPTVQPYVPLKPTPVQIQPQIGEESADEALFDLGKMIHDAVQGAVDNNEKVVKIYKTKNEVRGLQTPHRAPHSNASEKDDLHAWMTKGIINQIQRH